MRSSSTFISIITLLSLYHHHPPSSSWSLKTTNPLKRTLILYILCLHKFSPIAFQFLVILFLYQKKTTKTKHKNYFWWIEWINCGHNMKQSHFTNKKWKRKRRRRSRWRRIRWKWIKRNECKQTNTSECLSFSPIRSFFVVVFFLLQYKYE